MVGPSGCGKSTLLQILGGLLPATSGEVRLKGKPVTGPPREMIYVFQQYNRSLYPWRTVRNNVAFGLEALGTSGAEIERKCAEYIAHVGLTGFEHHYPHQLSGGMQQRVAVARALVRNPDVLLMDEAFGSVDAQTRAGLQDLLLRLWREYGFTVLFVTHDIDEAIYLAEKIVVLSSSPGSVRTVIETGLDYPRHQVNTRESERYLAHRRHLYSLVFSDSAADPALVTA
jgi:NitT/TauT family transport system ATP-binding protein